MRPRVHTSGNDRPHIVHGGYQYRPRDDGARFVRPDGEPSLLAGVGLLLGIATVAVLAVVMIGGVA